MYLFLTRHSSKGEHVRAAVGALLQERVDLVVALPAGVAPGLALQEDVGQCFMGGSGCDFGNLPAAA